MDSVKSRESWLKRASYCLDEIPPKRLPHGFAKAVNAGDTEGAVAAIRSAMHRQEKVPQQLVALLLENEEVAGNS